MPCPINPAPSTPTLSICCPIAHLRFVLLGRTARAPPNGGCTRRQPTSRPRRARSLDEVALASNHDRRGEPRHCAPGRRAARRPGDLAVSVEALARASRRPCRGSPPSSATGSAAFAQSARRCAGSPSGSAKSCTSSARTDQGIRCSRHKVVRGITLKREELPLSGWIADLIGGISASAQISERDRVRLKASCGEPALPSPQRGGEGGRPDGHAGAPRGRRARL